MIKAKDGEHLLYKKISMFCTILIIPSKRLQHKTVIFLQECFLIAKPLVPIVV